MLVSNDPFVKTGKRRLKSCAVLIIRTFITQHKELNEVLTNETSRVNYSRFYRAFALTSTDTIFTIPLAILMIYLDAVVQGPVLPWPGWSEVHYGFSRVDTIPAILWRQPEPFPPLPGGVGWLRFLIIWNQWIYVFCVGVFFAIYGTTREVFTYYEGVFWRAASALGLKRRNLKEQRRNSWRRPEIPTTMMFQSVTHAGGQSWSTQSMMQGEHSSLCVHAVSRRTERC